MTPMPLFVAFAGKKQVGKDTATSMAVKLLEESGKKVAVTAFAEELKEMCITILGLKRDEVYGTDEQKNKLSRIRWDNFSDEIRKKYATETFEDSVTIGKLWPKPRTGRMTNREVLQVMGTDIFRAIYSDVWAEAPFNKDWKDHDVVILTDCRFPNEVEAIDNHDGIIIQMMRHTGLSDDHPSETSLDGWTFPEQIVNDGSLEELQEKVQHKLKEFELL